MGIILNISILKILERFSGYSKNFILIIMILQDTLEQLRSILAENGESFFLEMEFPSMVWLPKDSE